ncbi:penicillin-binding protein, partial [Streptomyces sp. NPDC005728]
MTEASRRSDGREDDDVRPEKQQPPRNDETLHLKVDALRADATMQLRVPPPPEPPATGGRAQRRRSARTPALARLTDSARDALARLHTAAGPVLAVLAPYARRLKPLYPRPGRT